MATCKVWYNDLHGKRHQAQVEANTLFEAAALAALEFAKGGSAPGIITELQVQLNQPVHKVTMAKVKAFADRPGGRSPREVVFKQRLKDLLSAMQRVR
ncbi:MAG: hypothetical protein ABIR70_13295 [Bryobacteraceae bacterium]